MNYLSVCSGLDAPSVAWKPLGWSPVLFSEIEAFPCAVLKYRHSAGDVRKLHKFATGEKVPLWGDFTALRMRHLRRLGIAPESIDLLVGGTPCQSFSFAGKRGSLNDARGNLTLGFVRLAHALKNANPSFSGLVWENVPGVLNTRDNAFGSFLGAIVGADNPLRGQGSGKWPRQGMVAGPRARAAWRVLDAQHFGLAQRRKRVLLVASFGNRFDPAAVLFERKSVPGNIKSGSKPGAVVAALTASGAGTCGADDNQAQAGHLIVSSGDVSHCLNAGGCGRLDYESETLIAVNGRQDPISGDIPGALDSYPGSAVVAIALRGREGGGAVEVGGARSNALRASQGGADKEHVFTKAGVRRLTPREYERLQGFSDDYTLIPDRKRNFRLEEYDMRSYFERTCQEWPEKVEDQLRLAADGPRYRSLGNAMAVPVIGWIGERIAEQCGAAA